MGSARQGLRSRWVPNLLTLANRLDADARCCRAVVETPQGSRSKYDYDPDSGLFELAAVLPAGVAFPLAFGFVPGTLGEDGDPLDTLILSDEALPIGALVTVKLLGVIEALQTEDGETVRNDRLLGKVEKSHTWADVETVEQLGEAFTRDLSLFFETYNRLRDRGFDTTRIEGPKRACALIESASR